MKIKSLFLIILFFKLIVFYAFCQAPPSSDIYLFDLKLSNKDIKFSNPINLTNRPGYDNQPSFTADGKSILFSSIRESVQTDVYLYDIKSKTTKQLTKTSESEYSPTEMTGGKTFSVIRVEKDSVMRMCKFPISGIGEPTLISKRIDSVGYHCWIDDQTLAVFKLTEPVSLRLVYLKNDSSVLIAENIGRCIKKYHDENGFTYIEKMKNDTSMIMLYNAKVKKSSPFCPTLPGSEDYCWIDNKLIMAKGSKVYKYEKQWIEIADFSAYGITALSRIAVSPKGDKIAFVDNK